MGFSQKTKQNKKLYGVVWEVAPIQKGLKTEKRFLSATTQEKETSCLYDQVNILH